MIFGDDFRWRFATIFGDDFGDDFRWWITRRLQFSGKLGRWLAVYAQDYLCQMGVAGSEFDKHHHMLLLTIVVEVFRAAYEIPILELKFLFQTELVS